MASIKESFKYFSSAFNYAFVKSNTKNKEILQVLKTSSGLYQVDNLGYASLNDEVMCTFHSGEFFVNKGIKPFDVQLWLNDLDVSEIRQFCQESFGHESWGNLSDDQTAFLYAKHGLTN